LLKDSIAGQKITQIQWCTET